MSCSFSPHNNMRNNISCAVTSIQIIIIVNRKAKWWYAYIGNIMVICLYIVIFKHTFCRITLSNLMNDAFQLLKGHCAVREPDLKSNNSYFVNICDIVESRDYSCQYCVRPHCTIMHRLCEWFILYEFLRMRVSNWTVFERGIESTERL